MIWDTHMHSNFSTDCSTPANLQIESAIEKGLPGLCFTDHYDLDYPGDKSLFQIDCKHYFTSMESLRTYYQDQIHINIGIEMGLQPHLGQQISTIIHSQPFDYVIGSTHLVDSIDPASPSFFQNRSELAAYTLYFEEVYNNLRTCPNFDALGHLDYVVRYGPTKDEHYSFSQYQDIIDAILLELIHQDKSLEINTGAYRCGLHNPNPNEEIIARYHKLGGRLITIGADAHFPKHVGLAFNLMPALLARCGFTHYAVYTNRIPTLHPLS